MTAYYKARIYSIITALATLEAFTGTTFANNKAGIKGSNDTNQWRLLCKLITG
jgi:hypothetical protein